MPKLPDNEKPKKDLIDLVREGKTIEIYENVPLLKEGDILSDWKESDYDDDTFYRTLVGKKWVSKILWFSTNHPADRCKFCSTPYHFVRHEKRVDFIGRDNRTYSVFSFDEDKYRGVICPKCGYRTSYTYSG